MQVNIERRVEKQLLKLPREVRLRATQHILGLEYNVRPANSRKLAGHSNLYRLRIGSYRIIYRVGVSLVMVEWVGHRKDAYRW